jgi:DNA-binding Xre family transcriptional regulator
VLVIPFVITVDRNTIYRIISNTSNSYIWLMIVIKLQQLARKHGIENAYQFQKFTGFPPSQAANLWKANWSYIKNTNLNKLCNLFNCTPNDILEFTPDEEPEN